MFSKSKLDIQIINEGYRRMSQSTITICSIVRNCNYNLKQNIPRIDNLRRHFQDSYVIIFENDSIDGTKKSLERWSTEKENVFIECADFKTSTIVSSPSDGVNRYFSRHRIEKMAAYRNKYLEKIKKLEIRTDFLMIIDLDINSFSIEGVAHSFGLADYWDVVASNCYSINSKACRRYHDSYALVEMGYENVPQTEAYIKMLQSKWSFLRAGQPLMSVYSAHGGMSIYRFDALNNIRYRVIENKDPRVQVRCEHFALCRDIRQNGFERIFINPNMSLCYQTINFGIITRYLKKKILKIKD